MRNRPQEVNYLLRVTQLVCWEPGSKTFLQIRNQDSERWSDFLELTQLGGWGRAPGPEPLASRAHILSTLLPILLAGRKDPGESRFRTEEGWESRRQFWRKKFLNAYILGGRKTIFNLLISLLKHILFKLHAEKVHHDSTGPCRARRHKVLLCPLFLWL